MHEDRSSGTRQFASQPSSRLRPLHSLLRSFAVGLAGWMAFQAGAAPFSYQGRLVDGSGLGNGNYELTFRLFDSLTGGLQVGSTVVMTPVGVTNGLFTVELEFGNASFPGAARWLELSARVAGTADTPETLAPRQPINAVPYAIRALTGSTNAADLVFGTLPDARLSSNIPRITDLTTLSNALSGRITALETALSSLSNQVRILPPAGVPAVSSNPADPSLVGAGWTRFSTVPAAGWVDGNDTGEPSARTGHSAVWSGTSWLIWGGSLGNRALSSTGAGYDPSADQWTAISELNPPSARRAHTAVWTGNAMLVWGGLASSGVVSNGSQFAPGTGNWTAIPTTDAPAARQQHVAVWTGARMLVWGGRNPGGLLNDGKLFDASPSSQSWSSLPSVGAPEGRVESTAVWTGSSFVVWGGVGALGELGNGGILPLTAGATPGAWTATATSGAPSARTGHSMVWTGSRVLIWGGSQGSTLLNTGASFDPVANTWTPLPTTGAPSARAGHVAVWSGSEMLIFAGQTGAGGGAPPTGGAYNPTTGQWRPLSSAGNPMSRTEGTAAWTGSELLIFGGSSGPSAIASLERLDPQPTWYLYRKP